MEFLGLNELPSTPAPVRALVFESASHTAALEGVASALLRGDGLRVVTGATGTGKTTLCQSVGERGGPRAFVAVISCPSNGGDELLRQVLHGFGMLPDTNGTVRVSRRALLEILQRFLVSLAPLKGQPILVVDDAQRLEPDMLESLALLVNVEIDGRRLLQVVLVGQPELNDLLARTDVRHVNQHISWRHELTPLGPAEVPRYVECRLRATIEDRSVEPFTESAMRAIVELSGGVPALVNLLCDRSLQDVHFDRPGSIDRRSILRAAKSTNLTIRRGRPLRTAWRLVGAATVLALVIVAVVLGRGVRNGALARGTPALATPGSRASGVDDVAANGTSGPGPSTAPAVDALKNGNIPSEPLDALLSRAKTLAAQPDVKALALIRDDVAGREARATDAAVKTELESALQVLDRYLTDARRQQLLIDGRRLTEQERGLQSTRGGR